MVLTPDFRPWRVLLGLGLVGTGFDCALAEETATPRPSAAVTYRRDIEPILKKYCHDCHADGMDKGGVAFDAFKSDAELMGQTKLWLAALKNTRAGLMPPKEEGARPSAAELDTLARWIKHEAFALDPENPEPGRVTVRRLNRVEYRNTIRDLLGYDFNAEAEFPPDDSGNGFDNNGDVLTVSPLLLEKYLAAAETIVDKALPKVGSVMRERSYTGKDFRGESGRVGAEQLSAKKPITVSKVVKIDQAATYQVVIELESRGSFDFDPARCDLVCRVDGEVHFKERIEWSERKTMRRELQFAWQPGDHVISFEVVPLPPGKMPDVKPDPFGPPAQTRVDARVAAVTVRGPLERRYWTVPENHARFFPAGPAPEDAPGRDRYARQILGRFAERAFRRPVSSAQVERLVGLARQGYEQQGRTFEEGVGRAMMAVLASPRFIFRLEEPVAGARGRVAPVDEFSLASRLSYFLWSTMPDETLFDLARRGELRSNLAAQVSRMLKDSRAQALVRNFTGQWLQARDVESVPINGRIVLGPDAPRNREGRIEFDGGFRRAMRSETELYFDHILQGDRSLLELIDSDYTFLNERLAQHYGIPGVTGDQLRLVRLPQGSVRGGVLTQGTVLAVTSNPTRTSPVKRGLFILDNFLGTPPPPPPANVPNLEDAKKEFKGREPRLSEMLALHRENKLCSSCHNRMDPLGLAFENFNALGGWRDTEARQTIDAAGELASGERFADVKALKQLLAGPRRADFYRCMAEKMLTYALGRGLEYYDVDTVDAIATRLEREQGRISVLLDGVIRSSAFQNQRIRPAGSSVSLR